jgi:hypothetical protein
VKSGVWQIHIRQNHNQQHEKKHAEEDAEDRRFELPPCHDAVLFQSLSGMSIPRKPQWWLSFD